MLLKIARSKIVALLVALTAIFFNSTNSASAVGFLVSANPSIGQSLKTAPHTVSLEFSVPSIPASFSGNVIRVTNTSGKAVEIGAAKTVGMTLSVPLQDSLPAGVYQVAFRYVCDDGHILVSAYNFTVLGQAEVSSAPTASSRPLPTSSPKAVKPSPQQASARSTAAASPSASSASSSPEPSKTIEPLPDATQESMGGNENTAGKTVEQTSEIGGWLLVGALVALGIGAFAVISRRRRR